jgi:hypothetical protein
MFAPCGNLIGTFLDRDFAAFHINLHGLLGTV